MLRTSILIVLALFTNLVFGQNNVFKGKQVLNSAESVTLKKFINAYDIYEIDADAIHQYVSSKGENNSIVLELGSKYSFDMNLTENHIFKKGIQVRYATENGIEPGELTKIRCYQGFIHGTDKRVALSVNTNHFSGLINVDGDDLFFEPLSYLIPGAPENQVIFYKAKDYKESKEFKCLAKERSLKDEEIKNSLKNQPEFVPNLCKEVEIAEASDKSMCTTYGSITSVQDRITSVINAVQANYNGSFNTDLTLTIVDWFNVTCTGTDPWSSSTDPEVLLNSFTAWGPTNFSTHDIGQLFTFRNFDGSTVGIAWVEEVCTSHRYSCIQDWTNNLNLMRCTVAHEIGHNFSCDHDASAGFIMSPSVSNTNTWSSLSISSFNTYVPTRSCLSLCAGGSAPLAEFTSNKVDGCKPLVVSFTDLSTNAPLSWSWTFPGGTPAVSTAQNPTVTYNLPGVYSVTLIATNTFGSSTITKTNYITVNDKPVANFTFTKSEGSVQFTNTSTGGVSYSWNFGDGEFSTDSDPDHEYAAPGVYTVTLIVTNECGTSTKTTNITIVFIPIANFSSDVTEGCIPFVVHFQDESQFTPTSWLWTFPGGNPSSSTQKNPSVTYTLEGEYKVTLKATNSEGSNTISIDKYIKAKDKPVANFTSSVNGHTVTFTNTTPGTGNTYLWDFGDGETSTDVSPVHYYQAVGDYSVQLIATNACGFTSISKSVTVLEGPKAAFISNLTSGCVPLSVQFTDQSTHTPTNWQWIFEGGIPSSSTNQNPSVIYNTPGQYNVTLIVSNSVGNDTLIKTHYISVLTTPVAAFTSILNGATATFTNQSTYGVTYQWSFGDGQTSNQQNPVHTYLAEGAYNVTLTVTNPCGTNTIIHPVNIVFPPEAAFSSDKTSGCEPLSVQFTNNSSQNVVSFEWQFPGGNPASSALEDPLVVYQNPGNYSVTLIVSNSAGSDTLTMVNLITVLPKPISAFTYLTSNHTTSFNNNSSFGTSWHWDFGDGETSTQKDPIHEYEQEGQYTVILTVTNACGSTVLTKTVNILFPPDANFSADETTGCNNLTVTFEDLSNFNATSWNWTFEGGNPSTSNLKNPTVTYNATGSFDVQLIAGNAQGFDTIVIKDYILISSAPPISDFSHNSIGLTQNFINESSDAYSYKWFFGDGGQSTEKDPVHTYNTGGNFTVTMIAYNGCGSDTTISQILVVGAAPMGSFESNLNSGCLPLVVEFNDSSVGGASTWNWSFPGGDPVSSNLENPVVSYNNAGTYTVTLIVGNSFGSDTITKINFIQVSDVPVGKFSYLLQGTTVKFNNQSIGGNTFLWNFGDSTTSFEENPSHTYTTKGKYTVTLTVSNECGSFVFTQVVDLMVSVNEIDFIESLSVYPNPNSGSFTISISSEKDTKVNIHILDIIGRELEKSQLELIRGLNTKEVNLNEMPSGQYLLLISSERGLAVEKLIIK